MNKSFFKSDSFSNILLGLAIFFFVLYTSSFFAGQQTTILGDSIELLFCSFVISLIVYKNFVDKQRRRIWISALIGFGIWYLCNIFQVVGFHNNIKWLYDLGGTGYYFIFPFTLYTLALLYKDQKVVLYKSELLDGISLASVGFTFILFYFHDTVFHNIGKHNPMEAFFPFVDMIIISLVILLLFLSRARFRLPLVLVGLGFIISTLGDIIYLQTVQNKTYSNEHYVNIAWSLGIFIIAAGCFKYKSPVYVDILDKPKNHIFIPLTIIAFNSIILSLFNVINYDKHFIIPTIIIIFVALTRLFLTITNHHQDIDQVKRIAQVDIITGLGNNYALQRQFSSIIHDSSLLILTLDLNGFKEYNDLFGHAAGDKLLYNLGQKLNTTVDKYYGYAFRQGGDEFCALIPLPQKIDEEIIIREIQNSMEDRGEGFHITAAIGHVIASKGEDNFVPLLKEADDQMYSNKKKMRMSSSEQVMQTLIAIEEEKNGLDNNREKMIETVGKMCDTLELSQIEKNNILRAVPLRNIGRLAIPDSITSKNGIPLNEEWSILKDHPLIAERILNSAPSMTEISKIVRSIWEHYDGTGYPDGLNGKNISYGPQIIAVVDTYYNLKTQKPYRKAYTEEEALEEIKKSSGKQFNPLIVKTFFQCLK